MGTEQPPGETTVNVNFPSIMTTRNEERTVRGSYDGADYGQFIPIELDFIGLTETEITWSTANYRRSTDTLYSITSSGSPPVPAAATSFQTMLPKLPEVILQNDAGLSLSATTNAFTNANVNMPSWIAPANGVIDQITLNFAVVQNVTVVGAGTATISSVDFSATSYLTNGQPDNTSTTASVRITPNTAFTALSAPGTNVLIVKATLNNLQFRVNQGQLVRFDIAVNETNGTVTRTIGISPLFPYLATDTYKTFYKPVIMLHVKGLPDAMDKITQYTSIGISGVNK